MISVLTGYVVYIGVSLVSSCDRTVHTAINVTDIVGTAFNHCDHKLMSTCTDPIWNRVYNYLSSLLSIFEWLHYIFITSLLTCGFVHKYKQ